jgi:hypothetical protein
LSELYFHSLQVYDRNEYTHELRTISVRPYGSSRYMDAGRCDVKSRRCGGPLSKSVAVLNVHGFAGVRMVGVFGWCIPGKS